MRRLFATDSWVPVGVTSLEPAADDVVRGGANGLVVAGPGAGKTELLAQRACYLLQTGTCRPPRQILAISFKTDAAANLRDRVRRRCGDDLSKRFHSLTFAAFSKGLIDRFGHALPEEYRPTPDYEIDFDIKKRMRVQLDGLAGNKSGLTIADISGIGEKLFYERDFVGRALPISTAAPRSVSNRAAEAMWLSMLAKPGRSQLDFEMIGRLAELLFRSNPHLLKAIRRTYSHVFLDEFQDTTRVQYAITRGLFRDSPAVLTAVGDSKQRIMTWAGAVGNIFEQFTSDFAAARHDLIMNYRSAPRLVRIQQTLIAAIEPGTPVPTAADDGKEGEGECRVLVYPDHAKEAAHLAELVRGWVRDEQVRPRDICVLTRNKPAEYTGVLIQELTARGIKARVETDLQDLLVEPLVRAARDVLSLAVRGSDRDAWTCLVALFRELRGLDDADPRVRTLERGLTETFGVMRAVLAAPGCTLEVLQDQLSRFYNLLGLDAFRRLYPEYVQADYFVKRFEEFTEYLWQCYEAAGDWPGALADFRGDETVPIITVHKSKGLEYHSVVFMGLEDSALWGFANQSEEEKRAFFVAFSRAKKRVLFTFCHRRETQTKSGRRSVSSQSRRQIGVLYDLLARAGVVEEIVI